MNNISICRTVLAFVCVAAFSAAAFSQEVTYQGFLKQNGVPLNGTYDIRLELYASATGGSFIFSSFAFNVPVANGIFASSFTFANPGNDPRWVEVSVRPAGTSTWTNLMPRQPLTYTPLAINSLTLAGINADGFIRNTGTQQTATNFNIGGTGTANVFNATTQFNLNGARILSAPPTNLFIGQNSGANNTSGDLNTFAGYESGFSNTTGNTNAFYGAYSGNGNIDGHSNTFFGVNAGRSNIGGIGNAFFGSGTFPLGTGQNNTTGSFNVYFGHRAGEKNNGSSNTYLGTAAGRIDQSGNSNTFIGHDAGDSNDGGTFNVVLGDNADVGSANLTNAAAIGSKAQVTQSNSLVLGSINGVNGATADTNVGIGTTSPTARLIVSTAILASGENTATFRGGAGGNQSHIHFGTSGDWYIRSASSLGKVIIQDSGGNVGIGTTAPTARLTVATTSTQALRVEGTPVLGRLASFGGNGTVLIDDNVGNSGGRLAVLDNGNVGIGNNNPLEKLNVNGNVALLLSSGGGTNVCQNAQFRLATCGSSLRYKQNIAPFGSGLDLVRRLRPVTFHWKSDNALDMGLVAEEVAEVEPLLVTRNEKNEVEGVKYDRMGVVLINAVKEQQAQIESQQKQIEQQRSEIEAMELRNRSQQATLERQQIQIESLMRLICKLNQDADVCRQP